MNPDGSKPDENSVQKLQRMYVEWFVEEIEKTAYIHLPVLTAACF